MRTSVVAGILAVMSGAGCATSGQARYVYQDGQYGVVGIPENSDNWPFHYKEQAQGLMRQHFPEGFEIVRAEEVEEGSRTLTTNGANAAEIDAGTVFPMIKLAKIGRTSSKIQADNLKIKECRILYKKAGTAEPEGGFALLSTLSPEPYLDPNADARKHVVARPVLPAPGDPKSPEAAAEKEKSKDAPLVAGELPGQSKPPEEAAAPGKAEW